MATRTSSRPAAQRADRVSDAIREALGVALLREASDPRLAMVSVTDVRVTADIRHAIVYWVPLNPESDAADRKKLERTIRAAGGFFRSTIARALNLKFTPEVELRFDDSLERGRQMDALIAGLHPAPSEGDES